MSLRLVPEALAATPPMAFDRPAPVRPDTRPIESAGQASANSTNSQQQQSNSAVALAVAQAAMSPRPPGVDPSLPPQSVFDASLISATFKPSTRPAELESRTRSTDAKSSSSDAKSSSSDTKSSSSDTSSENTGVFLFESTLIEMGPNAFDAGKQAAYAQGTGGSPLSAASSSGHEWMSAVERIA